MTTISSECPRCGTIAKSGKTSCCGRGGDWFKNCGGVGNTKLHHTWYEGVQACKARSRFKTHMVHQPNVIQANDRDSFQVVGVVKYKTVIETTKMFSFASVNTSSNLMPATPSTVTAIYTPEDVLIIMSAHTLTTNTSMVSSANTPVITSLITEGYMDLLKIIFHINIWFIVVS